MLKRDDTNKTHNQRKPFLANPSLRIVLLFLLYGSLWIFATDRILAQLVQEGVALLVWQTYKGWVFVAVCSLFLYWLLRREERRREEVQNELHSTESDYRLLFESNPNPMWVYDLETLAFLIVNDAAVEKYGYPRDEFLNMTLFDLRPDEEADRLRKHLVDRDIHLDFAGEWRHQKMDGSVFPVEITSHALLLRGKKARLVVAIDISRRKQAEQTVRLQAAALEAAANGVAITDADGVIEWVNRAFTQLTGYSTAEAIGHNPRELVRSGRHDDAFYHDLWTTVLAGHVWHGEMINRRKDGTLYTEEQTITPVLDAEGRITRFVAIKQDVSARKAIETTLRENEERYRSLFANNYSTMLLIDPADGSIVDANAAAVAFYGWSIGDLRRMNIAQINTLSPPEIREEIHHAIEQQRNYFLFQHRCADGSIREVEVYSGPSPYEGRSLLDSIVHDITERKRNERELHTIAIMSAALGAVRRKAEMLPVVLDELMALLQVEGAVLEVLEPATGAFKIELGRGVWEAATGQEIQAGVGRSAQLIATGKPYLDNDLFNGSRIYRPDLPGACHAVAGAPLVVEGELTGALWIASAHDLSEMDVQLLTRIADLAASAIKRAALTERIHTQADQMAQIMDSVPEGVLLLDKENRIVVANLLGQRHLERLSAVLRDDILTQVGDTPLPALLTSPPAGGWHKVSINRQTYELIARPVESERGSFGWVMVIRDITDALSVQQQLQRHERLAAVGQLAAGIAHDFNNIMSVIVLYAQMLQEEAGLTDRQRERLAIIEDQVLRATRMIRQILDFSRQSILERQQLDLLSLVKEQVRLLERTLPENIEISFTFAEGSHIVKADPTRINQMITNLAINARDAMHDGGAFRIGLTRRAVSSSQDAPVAGMEQGDWIQLSVADTGSGIAPDVLEHIFEPFFTTKEPHKGTGLGLAQVHGIVGQHEGCIAVESHVGAGTTFTIWLPAVPLLGEHHTATRLALAARIKGNGERVLVVEDNQQLRQSLVDVLQAWNYQPSAVSNGEEALAQLREQGTQVDLIVSDVVMPKLGGIGLFLQLHQSGHLRPTILISGHPLHDELAKLRSLGPCSMLPKPISMDDLAETVAKLLASPASP